MSWILNEKEMNAEIRSIYSRFQQTLQENAPEFFIEKEYSNMFCIGVPDGWKKSAMRVMIVGQEGAWGNLEETWEDIKKLQDWSKEFQYDQLYEIKYGNKKNYRSFWKRFRFFSEELQKMKDVSFCYANIDAFCYQRHALKPDQREKLHGAAIIQVLREIVKMTEPTHVIFFGWHNVTLKHEFPEMYETLCPKGKYIPKDFIDKGAIVSSTSVMNGINFIVTYHPSFVISRTGKYADENAYRDAILECLK